MATKHRGWCLTINNPFPFALPDFTAGQPTYWIRGFERGESGTPHFQCFVYYRNAVRFSTLRRRFPRAHISPARGTPAQNRTYCSKDGAFEEAGDCPAAGSRVDLAELYEDIKSGSTNLDLLGNAPAQYFRYYRAIQHVRFVHLAATVEQCDVAVHVRWGPTGSGKTRHVYDIHPDVYDVDVGSTGTIWWDGYRGESCILFDDFYGQVKYSRMLKLCDRYPIKVQIKHGSYIKMWKTIYITSNKHPDDWWPNVEDKRAMARRYTTITEVLMPALLGPGF